MNTKLFYTFIIFLFILYYSYMFFVFYKLDINSCNCKKLELFKNNIEFKFLFFCSLVFFFFNVQLFIKRLRNILSGGSNDRLYYTFIIMITLGYGTSFICDYILINFFRMMDEKKCPCQKENRKLLVNLTYCKTLINLSIFSTTLFFFDKKMLQKIEKTLKKKIN